MRAQSSIQLHSPTILSIPPILYIPVPLSLWQGLVAVADVLFLRPPGLEQVYEPRVEVFRYRLVVCEDIVLLAGSFVVCSFQFDCDPGASLFPILCIPFILYIPVLRAGVFSFSLSFDRQG